MAPLNGHLKHSGHTKYLVFDHDHRITWRIYLRRWCETRSDVLDEKQAVEINVWKQTVTINILSSGLYQHQ